MSLSLVAPNAALGVPRGCPAHPSPCHQLRLNFGEKAVASTPVPVPVPLCPAGLGRRTQERPQASPCPTAVDPHCPLLLIRKCPISGFVLTGVFLSEKREKNHSIGFESQEWEQEPTPEDKCSGLCRTQILENNNKYVRLVLKPRAQGCIPARCCESLSQGSCEG